MTGKILLAVSFSFSVAASAHVLDCKNTKSHFVLDTERATLTLEKDEGGGAGETIDLVDAKLHYDGWKRIYFRAGGPGPAHWNGRAKNLKFFLQVVPDPREAFYDLRIQRQDPHSGGYEIWPHRLLRCAVPGK